jgi:hypothetical protein
MKYTVPLIVPELSCGGGFGLQLLHAEIDTIAILITIAYKLLEKLIFFMLAF